MQSVLAVVLSHPGFYSVCAQTVSGFQLTCCQADVPSSLSQTLPKEHGRRGYQIYVVRRREVKVNAKIKCIQEGIKSPAQVIFVFVFFILEPRTGYSHAQESPE